MSGSDTRLVGSHATRVDAAAKVTGRAEYTADIRLPGMLHIAVVRSPFARAGMGDIHSDRVLSDDAVVAVVSASQAPTGLFGPYFDDQPVFARDETRYIGEPVAAVVAESREAARFAADDLVVDWEPREAVTSVEEALAPAAPALHPEPANDGEAGRWLEELGFTGKNVCHVFERSEGDVDAAMGTADLVVDGVFEVPPVQHYALEPHAALARWDGEVLEVWTTSQSPFVVRRDLAKLFGLALNQVIVRVPYVGGGFGGKLFTKIEPLVAACALAVPGRAVRLELSQEESAVTITRHAARVRIKTGVRADGVLVAREVTTLLNTGAYADAGKRVADKAGFRGPGPYRIPNLRSRACAVYTNLPPAGAYRGFGAPQVAWAYESQMDQIAERLGMDPVELRRRNLLERGERFDATDTPLDCDMLGSFERVVERVGADPPTPPRDASTRTGIGFATALKDGGGQRTASSAEVRLEEDGGATCLVGSTEIGQGTVTALAQIVGEELGIPMEGVRVSLPDTAAVPYDSGTNASRTITLVGSAVVSAARDVVHQLEELFRQHFALDRAVEVVVSDGRITGGGVDCGVAEFMKSASTLRGGQIIGRGYFRTEQADTSLGALTAFWEPGIAGAEVSVDVETGTIEVLRYVSALDVGTAINPLLCEGQDQGAVMQGLGHVLLEDLEFDHGQVVNPSMVDYRVPSFREVPACFETLLIENHDGPGPYGARGIGEGGLLPVAPVIGNAVAAAVGVRLYDLPLTPESVWRALRETGPARPAGSAD